ncbi:formylglycine-generating enzyme family protein [Thermodesulfobacteriota bacterium B35]
MAFRPVCLDAGDGYFAWQRFRVGDPSGSYKESPTGVALGGSFLLERNGGGAWCYYLGKYEVSEDQYAAVTGLFPEYRGSRLPVRNLSWFDAQDFIRAYNRWLFAHGPDRLPAYGGLPGYLRLPTEEEWEFAARGGSRVDSGVFDRKTPYAGGRLADHEWFSGPKSSHNKVKKIGILKPNPLGLHDMLGNVAEMTRSLYRVEYYQGRSGGFVARGGHYLTDARQMRSSMRSEQEFYAMDRNTGSPAPAHKATLGFRLVISSLVFPNRQVSRAMKEAWEEYRKGRGQALPAAVSTSSTATRTRVSGTDAASYLDRLQRVLAGRDALTAEVRQELDNLRASLGEIQFTVEQAARDSAYAWLKIGAEQAFFLTRQVRKLPILHRLEESARKAGRDRILKQLEQREEEISTNIDQALSSYSESIRQLGDTGDAALDGAVKRYSRFLDSRKAATQARLLVTVQRHAREYMQSKRVDTEKWRQELLRWQPGQEAVR